MNVELRSRSITGVQTPVIETPVQSIPSSPSLGRRRRLVGLSSPFSLVFYACVFYAAAISLWHLIRNRHPDDVPSHIIQKNESGTTAVEPLGNLHEHVDDRQTNLRIQEPSKPSESQVDSREMLIGRLSGEVKAVPPSFVAPQPEGSLNMRKNQRMVDSPSRRDSGEESQEDADEFTEDVDVEACPATFETPSPDRKQRCCRFKQRTLTCLPNLVILGAQKAGSTALHSYLLFHPNILPARKKELHVFDIDRSFLALGDKLRMAIPPISLTSPAEMISPPVSKTKLNITLDSSPSYLADRRACPRMARVLAPDARFVLLLRDPVERLWSDVLMKKRRVDVQDEFLQDLLPQYQARVYECVQKHLLRTYRLDAGDGESNDGGNRIKSFRSCVPEPVAKHGRIMAFMRYINTRSPHSRRFLSECLSKDTETLLQCVRPGGDFASTIFTEKMPDIPGIIYNEAHRLEQQMIGCCDVLHSDGEGNNADEQEHRRPRFGPVEDCFGCGCRCFPKATMMSDISKNFVWRSMYHPQLVHCLQSIPRERILMLDMKDLRSNPAATLSRVFKHAGLPDFDLSGVTPHQARELFNSHYPDFETISGWTHAGKHAEYNMPRDLREFLTEFFRPFNRRLFDLLGVKPFDGWGV